MFGLFQNLPRLPTMSSIRIIEDDAFVARKDRGVDCADIGVERGFADIERGLKPLQHGRELGKLERGAKRRRDRTQPETGIIGNEHFGPIPRFSFSAGMLW
jgi:hypothetical protein